MSGTAWNSKIYERFTVMIRRLQLKIVAVVLGTLLLVFAAVLIVLNLSVYQASVQRANEFMASVIEGDGLQFPLGDAPIGAQPDSDLPGSMLPFGDGSSGEGESFQGQAPIIGVPAPQNREPNRLRPFTNTEMVRMGRFFYVKADGNGEIFEQNLQFMYGFQTDDVLAHVASAFGHGGGKGSVDGFSFMIAQKPYGSMLVFVERSIDILLIERLNRTSVWVAGIVSLVLAILAAFLAKWMVAPVKNSLEKQRRFISDASHELKTPLTIISANADVLEHELGANIRLEHIKAQSARMSELVYSLLTLAKTDEEQPNVAFSSFSLSAEVLNTALEFESRVFEEGRKYTYDVDENIVITGDAKQIKQLVAILIDNAVRYSDEKGIVEVTLRAEGPHHARISVFNTGIGVPDEQRGKIFERFYRTDESRNRETGGFGVGLSIAQKIVEMHKGKITATGEHMKWIRFDVILNV